MRLDCLGRKKQKIRAFTWRPRRDESKSSRDGSAASCHGANEAQGASRDQPPPLIPIYTPLYYSSFPFYFPLSLYNPIYNPYNPYSFHFLVATKSASAATVPPKVHRRSLLDNQTTGILGLSSCCSGFRVQGLAFKVWGLRFSCPK